MSGGGPRGSWAGSNRNEMAPESSVQNKGEAINNKRICMFAHWCSKLLMMVLF